MKTLTFNLPDNLEIDHKEIAMIVASRLYEQGIFSLAQAAEFAGMKKRIFAESLGKYNV